MRTRRAGFPTFVDRGRFHFRGLLLFAVGLMLAGWPLSATAADVCEKLSCTDAHGSPGCDDPVCEATVCAPGLTLDGENGLFAGEFCCYSSAIGGAWNDDCVILAEIHCTDYNANNVSCDTGADCYADGICQGNTCASVVPGASCCTPTDPSNPSGGCGDATCAAAVDASGLADGCLQFWHDGCAAVAHDLCADICAAPCDDGDACTVGESCHFDAQTQANYDATVHCEGSAPVECDDGIPCTQDACDSVNGCSNIPIECDDGNVCTGNLCDEGSGECLTIPLGGSNCCEAHDGGGCDTPVCSETIIGFMANCADLWDETCAEMAQFCGPVCAGPVLCGGTHACETGSCNQGVCEDVGPVVCDEDGNLCTAASCDPDVGCTQVAANAGATCDDGDPCTHDDGCADGGCAGTPQDCDDGLPCTEDTCQAQSLCGGSYGQATGLSASEGTLTLGAAFDELEAGHYALDVTSNIIYYVNFAGSDSCEGAECLPPFNTIDLYTTSPDGSQLDFADASMVVGQTVMLFATYQDARACAGDCSANYGQATIESTDENSLLLDAAFSTVAVGDYLLDTSTNTVYYVGFVTSDTCEGTECAPPFNLVDIYTAGDGGEQLDYLDATGLAGHAVMLFENFLDATACAGDCGTAYGLATGTGSDGNTVLLDKAIAGVEPGHYLVDQDTGVPYYIGFTSVTECAEESCAGGPYDALDLYTTGDDGAQLDFLDSTPLVGHNLALYDTWGDVEVCVGPCGAAYGSADGSAELNNALLMDVFVPDLESGHYVRDTVTNTVYYVYFATADTCSEESCTPPYNMLTPYSTNSDGSPGEHQSPADLVGHALAFFTDWEAATACISDVEQAEQGGDAVFGECSHGPKDCDDNNACTTDTCEPGVGCTHDELDCSDDEPCTFDGCETVHGTCYQIPLGGSDCCAGKLGPGCDVAACEETVCQGEFAYCCDENGFWNNECAARAVELCGLVCVETPCMGEDTCFEGTCDGGACGNLEPIDCADGLLCTMDTCAGGACAHTPLLECGDDGNPCTENACVYSGGGFECQLTTLGDFSTCCEAHEGGGCDDTACADLVIAEDAACETGWTDDCATKAWVLCGLCQPVLCDDGDLCTENDRCVDGACAGSEVDCADDDLCTINVCDPSTGGCNIVDLTCDDGDACTTDYCDPAIGQCVYDPYEGSCDDGDPCTSGDTCTDGTCAGGPTDCDDGDDCTEDVCDAAVACPATAHTILIVDGAFSPLGLAIEVGDTVEWINQDGAVHTITSGSISSVSAGALFDAVLTNGQNFSHTFDTPGNLSYHDWIGGLIGNITVTAKVCPNACVHTPVVCDDGNNCTTDTCEGGSCSSDEGDCDDDDLCTWDFCLSPSYSGGANPAAPGCSNATSVTCDDGDACTDDVCEPASGDCVVAGPTVASPCCVVHGETGCGDSACEATVCEANPTCCLEDEGFGWNETCVNLASNLCGEDYCVVDCDDGDSCTTGDRCIDGSCEGLDTTCPDDGDLCTESSGCDEVTGECLYAPISCDDDSLCTTDTCDPAVGCVFTATICDDDNGCTTDQCDVATGGCTYIDTVSATCDDGNPCTVEGCIPATGDCASDAIGSSNCCEQSSSPGCNSGVCEAIVCAELPYCCTGPWDKTCGNKAVEVCAVCQGAPSCDDGDPCTTDDTCENGSCIGAWSCDDGDLCTEDSCGAEGCEHTVTIVCTDDEPCQQSVCDPASGGCVLEPDGATSDCCGAHGGTGCDDSVCQNKVCNYFPGCCTGTWTIECANQAAIACGTVDCTVVACDDGDSCSEYDRCIDGVCIGGPVDCDDDDACTVDSCSKTTGCQHEAVTCDDADACTTDTCDAESGCASTVTVFCEDEGPCTDEQCDKGTGTCVVEALQSSCCRAHGGLGCDDASCANKVCLADDYCCTTAWGAACAESANSACSSLCEAIACDDGNPCTTEDQCDDADCHGVTPEGSCDDGNPCTTDACDPATGGCLHPPTTVATPCNDGSLCTENDTCVDGGCEGTTIDCDDGDPCTTDTCLPFVGCNHNAIACDDDNACTEDACVDGACVYSEPTACDDGFLCTADSCNTETGDCDYLPTGASDCCFGHFGGGCEDTGCQAMVCDTNDFCCTTMWSDDCAATARVVCAALCDPWSCDDDTVCTAADLCREGVCQGVQATCNDGDVCTDDGCDPVSGCFNNAVDCSDGDLCTTDTCVSFSGTGCVSELTVLCDDDEFCTDDGCNPATGLCDFLPVESNCCGSHEGTGCSDAGCQAAVCTAKPSCCGDGQLWDESCAAVAQDLCVDTCAPHVCDDGDACTLEDACAAGQCVGKSNGLVCDDDNACTQDGCNPNTGDCAFIPLGSDVTCDDGNACTLDDACDVGVCHGTPKYCGDGDPCTTDQCNPASGECSNPGATASNCCYTHEGGGCDDIACNVTMSLVPGCDETWDEGCVEYVAILCPQLDCSPATCDDGDECTSVERCEAGECVPNVFTDCNDGSECTADQCDTQSGDCVYVGMGANPCCFVHGGPGGCSDSECSDAVCAAQPGCCDVAWDASCVDLANVTCGIDCTALPCDDGNPCSVDDQCRYDTCEGDPMDCYGEDLCIEAYCLDGECEIFGEIFCDDDEPCTTDLCVPDTGDCDTIPYAPSSCCEPQDAAGCDDQDCQDLVCLYDPLCCDESWDESCVVFAQACDIQCGIMTCDDGDLCTVDETCVAGECLGAAVDCGDTDPCTADYCDPDSGCLYPPTDCDDGNACTDETCDADQGGCVQLNELICDDASPCTDDSCDPAEGECVTTPATTAATNCCEPHEGGACDDGGCAFYVCVNYDGNCCSGDWTQACADYAVTHCAACAPIPCDDGDPCTEDDGCADGACAGVAVICDDEDDCTLDSCVDGACVSEPDPACYNPCDEPGACDDGDACTTDGCDPIEGCSYAPAAVCDDGSPCTDNGCDPSTGDCVYTAIAPHDCCVEHEAGGCGDEACVEAVCGTDAFCCSMGWDSVCVDLVISSGCVSCDPLPCDDGDACTDDDGCVDGSCEGKALVCEDDNLCTTDGCDADTGCTFPEDVVCDDGDACTVDFCRPTVGCFYQPVDCDDDNPCTIDMCTGGACVTVPNPATECGGAGCVAPYGDVTGDGVTTIVDFYCIAHVLSWWTIGADPAYFPTCSPSFGHADLNCNGAVDIIDWSVVRRLINGQPMPPTLDTDGDGCVDSCVE